MFGECCRDGIQAVEIVIRRRSRDAGAATNLPYAQPSVFALLRFVVGLPSASIVFDYGEPLENYSPERRARAAEMGARTAAAGEPWLTHFDPEDLANRLLSLGFTSLEDIGPTEMAKRFFGLPRDAPDRGAGPHVIFAGK